MSLTQIAAPYPIFTDVDGTPLDDGYIFIGQANQNPETNPIQVYWDSELTQPAPQPIRTNNGYPWRMGTPAMLYTDEGTFSVTVKNKKLELVIYAPVGFGAQLNNAATIVYNPAGATAVATTVQSKLREVVSIKDFGAHSTDEPGFETFDSTSAIQAAINAAKAIYIPQGTYLISGPIDVGLDTLGNKRIYGDGFRTTFLKATHSTATLRNKTSHYWIEMRDFMFQGDGIASVGISLGNPAGTTGSAAYDYLNNVYVSGCVDAAIEFNWLQYTQVEQCFFGGTSQGYGMLANRFLTSVVTNTTIIDNKYGLKIDHCSDVNFNYVNLYGPYGSTVPAWYTVIVDSYNVFLNHVTFENEQTFVNPLVIVNASDPATVTGNIWFNQCLWLGLAYNQNLVELQAGIRIFFQDCRAIHPTAGKYVVQNTNATEVYINDCYLGNSYTDYLTQYWTDGWVNGPVTENRSSATPFAIDYANKRIGLNNPPEYSIDINLPMGQSGLFGRLYGGNNNTYANRNLASHFLWSISSTSPNPNRGVKFDMNGTAFNINGTGYSGGYIDTADVSINLNPTGGYTTTCMHRPYADNTYSLGTASYRWSVVYAGTGTINTSDEREKVVREEGIEAAALRAWGKVNYCQFKFKDAIEQKGDGARWHFGLVAQRVKEAFESEGLDAFAYGLLCYDEWEDEYEQIPDGEGGYITGPTLIRQAGNRYGIRYEEALALECAYLRSKVAG